MFRILVSTTFLVAAISIIWLAFHGDTTGSWSALWLNLGTEIIGIVATVAIVDWLFERRRAADEARRTAWNVVHELDHAIWVWQGGRREFDFDELFAIISEVKADDPLPAFVQNLLMNVGAKASNTLRNRADLAGANHHLKLGMKALCPLARIRDQPSLLSPVHIAECVSGATLALGKAVGVVPTQGFVYDRQLLDPTIEGQNWRHYGE